MKDYTRGSFNNNNYTKVNSEAKKWYGDNAEFLNNHFNGDYDGKKTFKLFSEDNAVWLDFIDKFVGQKKLEALQQWSTTGTKQQQFDFKQFMKIVPQFIR